MDEIYGWDLWIGILWILEIWYTGQICPVGKLLHKIFFWNDLAYILRAAFYMIFENYGLLLFDKHLVSATTCKLIVFISVNLLFLHCFTDYSIICGN